MKQVLLASTILLGVGGMAIAADLPVSPYKAPVAVAPSYGGWTGLYGGLQFGYGWDWSGTDFSAPTTDLGTLGNSPQGITGGARLGYDLQTGPLVFGIITDINIADFKSNNTSPLSGIVVAPGAGGLFNGLSTSNTTSWWGTTNGRLGLSAFGDHFLPYITAGVAYGEGRTNISGAGFSFDASKTLVGWNAGVGIETRITKNVSAFIEGKFVDLGSVVVPLDNNNVTTGLTANQPFRFGVVEGGLNYRF